MKIVDPVRHRELRLFPRSLRGCTCGCLLGVIALTGILRVGLGWLLGGGPLPEPLFRPEAAQRLKQKIQTIARFYDPRVMANGTLLPTTILTEEEINSFLVTESQRLTSPLREALERPHMEIDGKQLVLRARLHLTRLAGTTAGELPWPLQLDAFVVLRGALEWVDGKGRMNLQSVTLGAIELPGDMVLDWLSWAYPPAAPKIELMRGFPLPFGTRGIDVASGRIVLEGS